ncbi:MAG: hypothetical protein QXV17_06485 [Candidatus Micrarchaeaceae archaeon]
MENMNTVFLFGGISQYMEILKNIKDQRLEGKSDLLLSSKDISFEYTESEAKFSVFLRTPDGIMQTQPSDWAMQQFAEYLDIPYRYIQKMLLEENSSLLNENMNYWLQRTNETRLVRTIYNYKKPEDKTRMLIALLSPRYRPLDNYDIMNAVLSNPLVVDLVQKGTFKMHHAYLTDSSLSVMFYDLSHIYRLPEHESDVYFAGLSIRNSEVGKSAFYLEPSLYRQVCSNGLIASYGYGGEDGYKRIHLGKRIDDIGNIWSNTTRIAEGNLILSQINDTINYALDPDSVQIRIEQLAEAKKKPIKPSWIDDTAVELGLTKEENQKIWDKIDENTRYGFIQATTSYANSILRDDGNPERATELQRKAWTFKDDDVWAKIEKKHEND